MATGTASTPMGTTGPMTRGRRRNRHHAEPAATPIPAPTADRPDRDSAIGRLAIERIRRLPRQSRAGRRAARDRAPRHVQGVRTDMGADLPGERVGILDVDGVRTGELQPGELVDQRACLRRGEHHGVDVAGAWWRWSATAARVRRWAAENCWRTSTG